VVFSCDAVGQVTGTASVVSLLRAPATAALSSVVRPDPPHVHADWDIHAIVRKMSDFNLTVAPVMDDHHLMIGVITVDDVLEQLLPTGWRRDYGMATAEE
jgi:Mg/Co/Ni transporter MgtE